MKHDNSRRSAHFSLGRASPEGAPRIAVPGAPVWLATYANEDVSHVIADYLLQAFPQQSVAFAFRIRLQP